MFKKEVFSDAEFARAAAATISSLLAGAGSVVLTGGTTAEKVYAELAEELIEWAGLDVLFSDERCVPPTDEASNFGMVERILFGGSAPPKVHRMKGEDDPPRAADGYHDEITPLVERGIDLVLLGMGADCHVGAMFPGSPALAETDRLCRPVERPDGMRGLTLTPPALLSGTKVVLIVSGTAKASAVSRVVNGDESADSCPARLLAGHPDTAFLLDEGAASRL